MARRFFLNEKLAETMQISGTDAHHIVNVLRMKTGDEICVIDPMAQMAIVKITSIYNEIINVEMVQPLSEEREPNISVHLAQGLPKGDKFEYIVQKAVELGVTKILPLIMDETVVKYDDAKKISRNKRWQAIAREAAKQSKRLAVPIVEQVQSIDELLNSIEPDVIVLALYEGNTKYGLKEILNEHSNNKSFLLIIGPEGGFSNKEVNLLKEHDVILASLGSRILRTETAAVVAVSAVMYHYGEIGG